MWNVVGLKDYAMHILSSYDRLLGNKEGRTDQAGTDSVLVASLQPLWFCLVLWGFG